MTNDVSVVLQSVSSRASLLVSHLESFMPIKMPNKPGAAELMLNRRINDLDAVLTEQIQNVGSSHDSPLVFFPTLKRCATTF